jgi:hypothetical protein
MLLVITKGINMVDFPRPIMIIMLVYPRPSSKQLDLNDKNGGSMGISWNIPIFVYILYIYIWMMIRLCTIILVIYSSSISSSNNNNIIININSSSDL